MKLNMILVFAVVVGAVAVPYILFILFGSNNKKLSTFFKTQATKQNLAFDKTEQWASRIIGIDLKNNVLFYAQLVQEQIVHKAVDLSTISRVNLLEDLQTKRIDGKVSSTLENLTLELIPQNSGAPILLNFYDSLIDSAQNFEMKRASAWKSDIQNALIAKQAAVVAA